MMTISTLVQRFQGLDPATVELWVAQEWVRPRREAGTPMFEEIDVARVQLILELKRDMEIGEAAMPVVLSLLDELHLTRARMRRLCAALEEAGEMPARQVVERLATTNAERR